jgi:hypothetical protein
MSDDYVFSTFQVEEKPEDEVSRLQKIEREMGAYLDELLSYAKRLREPREVEWDLNVRAFRGEHTGPPSPAGFRQRKINIIWRIVHQVTAQITDTRPKPDVIPRTPAAGDLARQLRKLLEAIFYLQDLDRKVAKISDDIQLYGIAFHKVVYDPYSSWGAGDISIVRVDPRHVYLDDAPSLEDMSFIVYRAPVPISRIRQMYPLRGHEVKADVTISTEEVGKGIAFSPILPPEKRQFRGVPRAWLEEWWIRDPSLGPDGSLLYPNGRVIVRAGGVILADGPNPYKDQWPGPWVAYYGTPSETSPWPVPDVSQYRPIQESIDMAARLLEEGAAQNVGGIWIADPHTIPDHLLENREYLFPRPGRVIIKGRPGGQLTRDPGMNVIQPLEEYIMLLVRAMDSIAGLLDQPAQKVPGGGVTSAAALEVMRAGSQAFIRRRAREIEAGLARLGQFVINRILQFYTNRRVFEVLGPDDRLVPEEMDLLKQASFAEDYEELFKTFRVQIIPGSSLALTKEREYAMYATLYCVSEDTEILTKAGWKKFHEVKVGESVLTVAGDLSRSSWESVKNVYIYEYNGEMVNFNSKHLPALVTPNHRWLVYTRNGNRRYKVGFVETEALKPGHRIPVRLPDVDSSGVDVPDDWLRLLGWVVTEGTYLGNWRGCVQIAQKNKACDLEKVLKSCGCEVTVSKHADGTSLYYVRGEAAEWVRREFPDKRLRYDFIASLSSRQARILLEEMLNGDGTRRGGRVTYFTCDPVLADQVAALAVVAGYGVSMNGYRRWPVDTRKRVSRRYSDKEYHVTIRKRRESSLQYILPKAETVFYKGVVWCPETPSGTWVARRNGVVFVTGNSMGAIDRQAFLEFIELPRREEILQRMAQAEAMLPQAVARRGPAPRGRGATITRTLLRQLAGETMGGRPGT